MNPKNVIFFVYDEESNFVKTKEFIASDALVKGIRWVKDLQSFDYELNRLEETDYICLVVHVFYTENIKGIKKFISSGIRDKYPLLKEIYASEGSTEKIKHDLVTSELPQVEIFKYHQIIEIVEKSKIELYTQKELINNSRSYKSSVEIESKTHKIDYAIITALYKNEFEELERVIDFTKEETIETDKKIYRIGYLKQDRNKKIVASFLSATGMVDAAIIATQMLDKFNPNYLLMSGVCGGRKGLNYGDVIVANQIFTFQKGKLSDIQIKNETGEIESIKLFDKDKKSVDIDHLYDAEGNQIPINIEKFEAEHDTILELDSLIKEKLEPRLKKIKSEINGTLKPFKKAIDILLEPIACSTMVINKKDYFEDVIKPMNRKTAAVEMESYGIARACLFANNGKTKAVIFKAVMDNMEKKDDDFKPLAARTSALFLEQLFIQGII